MRLWSLHPKYLDQKSLVAVWREGLLAQKVLDKKTKGYREHPQLIRFKRSKYPINAIGIYLHHIANEAESRGYRFNRKKIFYDVAGKNRRIKITSGQIKYEHLHLVKKLNLRDKRRCERIANLKRIVAHPLFEKMKGGIASWEKV